VPSRRLVEPFLQDEHAEKDADDRVRDRDCRDRGHEPPGRERDLLHVEAAEATDRHHPELPALEHAHRSVGVQLLDDRLHQRRGDAVEDARRCSEHPGPDGEAALAREEEEPDADRSQDDERGGPVSRRRVVDTAGRVADAREDGEPDDDHRGSKDVAAGDRLVRQEVPERQRPDDRRHEEGLDDRHAPAVERRRLEDNARDLGAEPEQPDPVREQLCERLRVAALDSRVN
jgi:hypothetical protein